MQYVRRGAPHIAIKRCDPDYASVHVMPPPFDRLLSLLPKDRVTCLEDASALKLNDCGAVLYREMASPWQKCVFLRIINDKFQIWNEAGLKRFEAYPYGLDSSGVALDDSIQSEWGLTLESPVSESTELAEASHSNGLHEQTVAAVVATFVKQVLANVITKSDESENHLKPSSGNGSDALDAYSCRGSTRHSCWISMRNWQT